MLYENGFRGLIRSSQKSFGGGYDLIISPISNYLLNFKKGENNEYGKQMLSFGRFFTGLKLNLLFNSKFYSLFNPLTRSHSTPPKCTIVFAIISNRSTSNSYRTCYNS